MLELLMHGNKLPAGSRGLFFSIGRNWMEKRGFSQLPAIHLFIDTVPLQLMFSESLEDLKVSQMSYGD